MTMTNCTIVTVDWNKALELVETTHYCNIQSAIFQHSNITRCLYLYSNDADKEKRGQNGKIRYLEVGRREL